MLKVSMEKVMLFKNRYGAFPNDQYLPTDFLPANSVFGFQRMPSIQGTPTAQPSGWKPGTIYFGYDIVNHQLCIYDGAWKFTGVSSVGTASLVAKADLLAQTAAVTSVTSYVVPANGTFEVGGYLNPTAIATDTIRLVLTYTDQNGNAITQNFATVSTTGDNGFSTTIRAGVGTINIAATLVATGGTITYDTGAFVRKSY